jgi:guanylate kinase
LIVRKLSDEIPDRLEARATKEERHIDERMLMGDQKMEHVWECD